MKIHIPRHRPAGIRRTLPAAVLLAIVVGALWVVMSRTAPSATASASAVGKPKGATQASLRRDAAVLGKPATAAPDRAAATPEPRKQRPRTERAVAPESKV